MSVLVNEYKKEFSDVEFIKLQPSLIQIQEKSLKLPSSSMSILLKFNFNTSIWNEYVNNLKKDNLNLKTIVQTAFKINEAPDQLIVVLASLGMVFHQNLFYSYLQKNTIKYFEYHAISPKNLKTSLGLKKNHYLNNNSSSCTGLTKELFETIEKLSSEIANDSQIGFKIINSNNRFTIIYKNKSTTLGISPTADLANQQQLFKNKIQTVKYAIQLLEENELDYKMVSEKTGVHVQIVKNLAIGFFPSKVLLSIKKLYKNAILNSQHFYINDFLIFNIKMHEKINGEVFIRNFLDLFAKMQRIQNRIYIKINKMELLQPSDKFNIGYIYKGNINFATFYMTWYLRPLGVEFRTFLWKKGFSHSVVNRARNLHRFLNCIIENNQNINSTKDIKFKDIEYGLKKLDVSLQQTNLSSYITFLQKSSLLEEQSSFGKLPEPPIENITKQFVTARKANTNHPPLPEIVYSQIYANLNLLERNIRNAFLLMSATGCRIDELEYINDESLQWNNNKKYYELSFYVSKSAKVKIKKGKSPNRLVPISDQEVIDAFNEQKQNTKELREKSGFKSIFVYLHVSHKIKILNGVAYSKPINAMIKKCDIKDEAGVLWHFTSHQLRASVATNLAENGYAPEEIMAFMNWESKETVERAYALIRDKRLMELNSQFFKEHFRADIPDENLNNFSLEERKSLFAELYVQYRQMEYGKCVRHPILGECGKLQEPKSCASCPKLITAKQYLPKWYQLQDSQQNILNVMKNKFDSEGISKQEYYRWAEFIREDYILNSYNNVIEKLENS